MLERFEIVGQYVYYSNSSICVRVNPLADKITIIHGDDLLNGAYPGSFFVFSRVDPIIGAYFVGLRLATGY